MSDLDELRREKARLLVQEQVDRDMEAYDKERRNLKADIWKMKHKKTVKVINVAKRSTVGVGMIFGKVGKAVAPALKQGARNFASNASYAVEQADRPRKRRVVRKKSPKKRIVKKVVRRNYNSMFGDNPFF